MRIWPEKTVDQEFADLGTAGWSGTLNDRQFAYLRNAGYTGGLPDMMFQLRTAPIVVPPTFSPADLSPTAWFSAMTASSLFTDTGGTTLVTQPTDLIARANDLGAGGRNATQATSGSRPTYSRIPVGGRRNLFTYTEQFDNVIWGKGNCTVTANAGTAPDGTTTADKLITNSATNRSRVQQNPTPAIGDYISVYAKAAEWGWVALGLTNGGGLWTVRTFNLNTGAVGNYEEVGGPPGVLDTPVIEDVGSGWYRCSVRVAANPGPVQAFIGSFNQSGSFVFPSPTLNGDGTSGILIWGAQVEAGALTNYQRVVTARDVTESGVSDVFYMFDDGADSLNWTAPAGTYTIGYVNSLGTVTILTGQALSGSADVTIPTDLVEYVAVDRALTGGETTSLTNYLQARANPL